MKPYKYFINFCIFFLSLNKVFNDFLIEAFANQPTDHKNVKEKEKATVSLNIPIMKQEHNSEEICILESDDDTFQTKVKPESINETSMPMDVELQHEDNFSNSVNAISLAKSPTPCL